MAEKIILNPSVSRTAESHSRRLPFAPIFDTIVAEPPPEKPLTIEEPATKIPVRPAGDGNGSRGPTFLPAESRTTNRSSGMEAVSQNGGWLYWLLAAGFLLLLAGMIYLGVQVQSQKQALAELTHTTTRTAPATADTRFLEQRPWVAINDPVPLSLTTAPGSFAVSLQDSGKTPAVGVKVTASVPPGNLPAGFENQTVPQVNRVAGALFPGAQYRTVLDFHFPPGVLAAIYRAQGQVELHINVTYEDIMHGAHTTQSCWTWHPALRSVEPCDGFGQVN